MECTRERKKNGKTETKFTCLITMESKTKHHKTYLKFSTFSNLLLFINKK